jgi:Fe-S cluster assembly protein SufD
LADMHTYIHITVPSGKSEWKYRVTRGVKLSLTFTSQSSCDACITVTLVGKGASATITGICIGKGSTKQVLHTMQIHEAPETTSNVLVKTVLSGHAACVYDGGIRVEKLAQKTDAYQRNENLLLSDHAFARSRPSLEILANDVRCTHGATVGSIDKEQLWYLASRGLPRHQAEALLVRGFISSALERVIDKNAKRSIISLYDRLY